MKTISKLKSSVILLLAGLALSLGSCRDFLLIDDYTSDIYTYDSIFSTQVTMEAYLWGAAASLPDEANFFGTLGTSGNLYAGISASDEAFNPWNRSSHPGTQYVLGTITADDVAGSRFNFWYNMYQIIRKTNIIIANVGQCSDITTVERNEFMGYTYFLRAYAYYHILMNQGPFIILGDDVLEANRESEYYNAERATYDECVEYICTEMERAARLLPIDRVSISQFGRPNRGSVYGIIARLRLQWASPLFNGGAAARQCFSDWRRPSDGAYYVNQTYDEERWAIAAAACKRIMDMGMYELYTVAADTTTANGTPTPALPAAITNRAAYPNGPGGIDPYRSCKEMFDGTAIPYQNKELLWGRWSSVLRAHTQHSFSVAKGGYGGMAVPQKIIDNFYMSDGTDCQYNISNGTIVDQTLGTKYNGSDSVWSGYRLSKDVNIMYVDREARFYANIGFQNCYWPMTSVTSTTDYTDAQRYADYSRNGRDGYASLSDDKLNYTMTGYVSKKYIHPSDAWKGTNASRVEKCFPIIRYAEILLSYAEALNNLTTSHTVEIASSNGSGNTSYTFTRDENEIANSFNLVRYRAGLPGLTAEQLADQDLMFAAIERERMIELFHENRRFFDVRRWGVYEARDSEPIRGMNVEATDAAEYYEIVTVNHSTARERVVNRRMVFFPLDKNELKKVPGLVQNPGW